MYRGIIIILVSTFFFGACVSNKKVQYLQYDDVNAKDVKLDSLVRTYSPAVYEHKIQPEDVLKVTVQTITGDEFNFFKTDFDRSNSQNLSGNNVLIFGELVDEKGEIEYPVIGKVKVAGLTVFEVQELLQKKAIENGLKEPVVKVRIMNFRFTILGETNREATLSTFNNRITMLEAIGIAGGFGELADRSKVKLIRYQDGNMTVSYLNFLDENFVNSPYFYLHQGDVLIVPPVKQRPFRLYFRDNLSLIVSTATLGVLLINTLSTK
jgi:polysaccharide export outer membrane protein